jgi:ribonuclease III
MGLVSNRTIQPHFSGYPVTDGEVSRHGGRPGHPEFELGCRFKDSALLEQALTHSSMSGASGDRLSSNERLEFLGDRVLGLVIAHILYQRFPDEPEGDLARRHAALVRKEALARIAIEAGLGDCVRMSRGEDDAGGRENPGLLADACEAVIGAIYLDGGLEAAAEFVHGYWQALVDEDPTPPKDAKTMLQEWAQGRGLALPKYRETAREGPPHAPIFSVEVVVSGIAPVTGVGPSKRAAEQAAADLALIRVDERKEECRSEPW